MSGTVCVWLVLVPATAASSIPHFKFVVFGYSQCYGNCANDRWGVRTKFWAGTFVCGLAGLVALPYDTSCWLFCIHCAVSAARLAVAFGVKYLTPSQAGGEASANRCPECGLDVREHPQNDACSYHRKHASDMGTLSNNTLLANRSAAASESGPTPTTLQAALDKATKRAQSWTKPEKRQPGTTGHNLLISDEKLIDAVESTFAALPGSLQDDNTCWKLVGRKCEKTAQAVFLRWGTLMKTS